MCLVTDTPGRTCEGAASDLWPQCPTLATRTKEVEESNGHNGARDRQPHHATVADLVQGIQRVLKAALPAACALRPHQRGATLARAAGTLHTWNVVHEDQDGGEHDEPPKALQAHGLHGLHLPSARNILVSGPLPADADMRAPSLRTSYLASNFSSMIICTATITCAAGAWRVGASTLFARATSRTCATAISTQPSKGLEASLGEWELSTDARATNVPPTSTTIMENQWNMRSCRFNTVTDSTPVKMMTVLRSIWKTEG